jgi:uncharacterized protein YfaP (DUF2135 family)
MLGGHLLGWCCCTAGAATGKQQAQHQQRCFVSLHIDHVNVKIVCVCSGWRGSGGSCRESNAYVQQVNAPVDAVAQSSESKINTVSSVTHGAAHDAADAAFT